VHFLTIKPLNIMKFNSLLLKITIISLFFVPNLLLAQLGVNSDNSTPSSNAMLDVKSTTKGVLIPRVTSDLASPTEGLLYYNTTGHNFRYYDGTAWQNALFGNQWNVNGTSISYSLGNVGIGTNAPVGALNIYSPTLANLYFHNSTTGTTIDDGFYIGNNGLNTVSIWNREAASIKFGTNNTEQMAITSSGNVGIGYSSPSYRLSVNGTIYSNGLYSNGFTEIVGTLQANTTANFQSTVNVNGTLNANGNLAVDGNITTNAGKGIVRSNDANQLAIDEFATPANLVWNLGAGDTICCIGIGFSTFTAPPSIAFGEITGTITNPSFITFTIESMTNSGAQIRVTNIGNGNSTASNATMHAMIIGRK
jgi:hypothetical protein